ncbi:hypothetical protein [Pseudoxanthomonas sacheonensis]|uniref:hypothetical protein n=1 Tax=Pseudoxanthomonas sacheonensis TaxID=443615 RepID=UPI0013D61C75|nr:hypothetical protein [Pseudoxanthomonas sacheonensis]KAF1706256.1 hypothetical protein CSC73_16245 [Pseudoxanthomonas sacheonensis]
MSTLTHKNRRWTDRAPLTARLGWSFWRAWGRIERDAADILGSIVVGCFFFFAGLVAAAWWGGA